MGAVLNCQTKMTGRTGGIDGGQNLSKRIVLVVATIMVPNILYWLCGGTENVAFTTMIGEFLIAFAIFWEVEEERHFKFRAGSAGFETRQERLEYYKAYFDVAGETLKQRIETFCESLWEEGRDDLRQICNDQVVHFDTLGYMSSRSLFRTQFVGSQPHSVIFCWIILGPYIRKRRDFTGSWWGCHFLKFALSCVGFVFRQPQIELVLPDTNKARGRDVRVTRDVLKEIECELRKELARLEVSQKGQNTRLTPGIGT